MFSHEILRFNNDFSPNPHVCTRFLKAHDTNNDHSPCVRCKMKLMRVYSSQGPGKICMKTCFQTYVILLNSEFVSAVASDGFFCPIKQVRPFILSK